MDCSPSRYAPLKRHELSPEEVERRNEFVKIVIGAIIKTGVKNFRCGFRDEIDRDYHSDVWVCPDVDKFTTHQKLQYLKALHDA